MRKALIAHQSVPFLGGVLHCCMYFGYVHLRLQMACCICQSDSVVHEDVQTHNPRGGVMHFADQRTYNTNI